MKRERLSKAFGDMEERFVLEAYCPIPEEALSASERIVHMKKKRLITIALAAALMLALGLTAYAAWSIHAERQQELRADLMIDENKVSSYVEYAVSEESAGGLVLLSAVSDGQEQRVYVNISPVSEEVSVSEKGEPFPVFTVGIDGTEIGGSAEPYAYDEETQTLTLACVLDAGSVRQAVAEIGTEAVPLSVHMMTGTDESRSFGPISFTMTGEQLREFDFGNAVYHDLALDQDIEVVGLELTPFSAVWKVHYEGDAAVQTRKYEDWAAYEPWCSLEDAVCREAKIVFSDGSEFSTGGSLNSHYENGAVNLWCGWQSAINMEDVQRIVLGDLILWEAK
ncbi:MAG: hypothetical protein ACI3W7_00895 [Oscillospiraceae bacterium]